MPEAITFPQQFPDAFVPKLVIEVPNPKDVAGFEDEIAYSLNPNHQESQWAARVALMHLLRPKNFEGSLKKVSFLVMAEPLARLIRSQAKGSGVRFYTPAGDIARVRRAYDKDFEEAAIDELVGMTMRATASTLSAELGSIELDVWYAKEKITKNNRARATGVSRVVTTPRYDEDERLPEKLEQRLEASKKRGAGIHRGSGGKVSTRGGRIDNRD